MFKGVSEKTFSHIYLDLILPQYYNNLDKFMNDFFDGVDTKNISLFPYEGGTYTGELIGLPSIKEGQFMIEGNYNNKSNMDYHSEAGKEWIEFQVYSGDEAYYMYFIGFETSKGDFKFAIPNRRNTKSIKNGIIDFVSQTPIELLIDFINIALLNKQEFENELKLTEFITKMIKAVSECEEDDNNHPLEDIFEDELNSKFLKEGFLVNEEILSIISKN